MRGVGGGDWPRGEAHRWRASGGANPGENCPDWQRLACRLTWRSLARPHPCHAKRTVGATGVVAWTLLAFVFKLGATLAVIPALGGAAYVFVVIDEYLPSGSTQPVREEDTSELPPPPSNDTWTEDK